MLETKICLQTGSAPSVTFTLAICNVGGSSLRGDYAASLRQDDAGPVLATAKLRHYPRWSESVVLDSSRGPWPWSLPAARRGAPAAAPCGQRCSCEPTASADRSNSPRQTLRSRRALRR